MAKLIKAKHILEIERILDINYVVGLKPLTILLFLVEGFEVTGLDFEVSMGELSKMCDIGNSAMSAHINRLVKADLVNRVKKRSVDARTNYVSLTEKGYGVAVIIRETFPLIPKH